MIFLTFVQTRRKTNSVTLQVRQTCALVDDCLLPVLYYNWHDKLLIVTIYWFTSNAPKCIVSVKKEFPGWAAATRTTFAFPLAERDVNHALNGWAGGRGFILAFQTFAQVPPILPSRPARVRWSAARASIVASAPMGKLRQHGDGGAARLLPPRSGAAEWRCAVGLHAQGGYRARRAARHHQSESQLLAWLPVAFLHCCPTWLAFFHPSSLLHGVRTRVFECCWDCLAKRAKIYLEVVAQILGLKN